MLENDRFFITHLLIEPLHKTDYRLLIKHLNDCYACFQIYSQFFKDYHQTCLEINQRMGG
ncbi:hypothetical protein EH223_10970 [candidate division KSB1 bacterium]|nr:hypothetical protein [candidate division KSB1 bacterium]RQW03143.1 MAG: hypothetical protein EH223_10970 [candidate division KSB1 bacterium]